MPTLVLKQAQGNAEKAYLLSGTISTPPPPVLSDWYITNAPTMSEVCDTPVAIMATNLSQLHPPFFCVSEDSFSLGYCLFVC